MAQTLEQTQTDRDQEVLAELDAIMRSTFQLWDQEWVGFSWRNYTYDHVRRVRNTAMSLGDQEGADTGVIDFATVLHDITKSYDGEIIMKDGKRVLDANGFWQNEFLEPQRRNVVTDLYDQLGLRGQLHNESGAHIAEALLEQRGYPKDFRDHVSEVIRSHLMVKEWSSLEGRCLYDADTIDANIGHPAFFRNVHIGMRGMERQYHQRGESVDDFLHHSMRQHLEQYVNERLPAWNEGKNRDFVPKMTTESGRRRAMERIERLAATVKAMREEFADYDEAIEHGRLAVVVYFIRNRKNPSLSQQFPELQARWPAGLDTGAALFLTTLQREIDGVW
jgi:hypothetical protein